ncbi:receptor-like serine/threonine-protein kinase SD1-7 isoform X2 [Coffea eugenioides]|uniref:receptor-like serine/threonine-protein kinase SD1-7 isoform X2 n=1 Tax=Coffea eugenioides TaxID=49369 RepID=UPI000F6061B4|nr:receptor-like serine/threonine-protein kinase SD1-7 isoform X2 [Coffea eugenioides]
MFPGIRTCWLFRPILMLSCTSYLACFSTGSDTISSGQFLFSNQTIISKEGNFELGFFIPGNSSNCYVGVWYKKIAARTIVWVANRENPIDYSFYSTSFLALQNGSLYIFSNKNNIVWSTSSSSNITTSNTTQAILLDNGNLVLASGIGVIWQSFDYPTDTWLPGGKIGFSRITNATIVLTSWKNKENPAQGLYSLGMDPTSNGEIFIWRNSNKLWRSGGWQAGSFPFMETSISYNFSYNSNDEGKYLVYNGNKSIISRIVIDISGTMRQYFWLPRLQEWTIFKSLPSSLCDIYSSCGAFGYCDISSSPSCSCLPGFEPQFKQDWDLLDFSGGCMRKKPINCATGQTGFLSIPTTRLPAYSESLEVGRAEICEFACSFNCSCSAFSYSSSGGCSLWLGNLLDIKKQQNGSTGGDLYLKLDLSELPAKGHKKSLRVALAASITPAIFISCCFFYCLWRRKYKQKGNIVHHQNLFLLDLSSNRAKDNNGATAKDSRGEVKIESIGLPVFSFSSIVAVTNNFSSENKLGEGGFGPVYKGRLQSGELVAVKRLSKKSGQGFEEFKNETELIAELQHRNLVRILGCCLEQDEKILIYEYMPNKSLDTFLFGLLYLHQYSRIRIVHRDLKASNILLDGDMDPKISDFGLARIFGLNELQANTNRIVGTYGYMSPEYVMEGLFSVKSDVFAFGILVLEIMSGKKNTGHYGSDNMTLIGYAWELWKTDRLLELIDPSLQISSSSNPGRYITIGLLCVQENPADRPTMSDVVAMLRNEHMSLTSPKEPAFTTWRNFLNTSSEGGHFAVCSANDVTISLLEAR